VPRVPCGAPTREAQTAASASAPAAQQWPMAPSALAVQVALAQKVPKVPRAPVASRRRPMVQAEQVALRLAPTRLEQMAAVAPM